MNPMHSPLANDAEFPRLARLIGALLTIVGGVALLMQTVGDEILPPPDGYREARAEVVDRTRRGTFQEPAFSVTLAYPALRPPENATASSAESSPEMIRSGRRVPFETYYALSEGQQVTIHYNSDDPFEWRLEVHPAYSGTPGPYAFGVLMIVIGLFVLALPVILRLALRDDEFDPFPDDVTANN
jgi:hypothetical protein